MRRALALTIVTCLCAAAGCGGDDDPTGPNGPGNPSGNTMTARIDGQAWAGQAVVTGGQGEARAGTILITGSRLSPISSLSLTLSFVNGPGTYPLGVNFATNAGGTAGVNNTQFWLTPFSGAAGTVTITTRTATRIAGTFAFTADATSGTPPARTVVTDGAFDVTRSTGLPALPTGLGSEMKATLDGFEWNAATILAEAEGQSFGGSTTGFALTFSSSIPLAAGQSYKIGPEVALTVDDVDSNDGWETVSQDSVGYVSVVTLTADRMIGSFGARLPAIGTATSPMVVADGSLDVHLQ